VVVQPYAAQKLEHLLRAEDDGEFLRCLGSRNDVLKFPLSTERDFVQENAFSVLPFSYKLLYI
jgi:hypothetical protein